MHRTVLALLVLLALPLASCGDDGADGAASGASGGLDVVATTTHVHDLVGAVGGDAVRVTGMIPANADPHDYEVRPADVQALADAKLVVRSGGDVDDWLTEAIKSAGSDPTVLTLIDKVPTRMGVGEDAGEVDPHWWQDPRNVHIAVTAIRDALSAADPARKETYSANAAAYTRRLDAMDRAVAACIDSIPAAQRKLVTTHDALGYYAERYGLTIIGTVIPSLTTQGQPSSGETARLVADIRRAGVKTVFAESQVNAKVERAIAQEADATIGPALFTDSLGPAGSEGDTLLKALAFNTRAIVSGLGGSTCRLPN